MSTTRLLYITTGLNLGGAEMLLYHTLKQLDRSRYTPLVICLRDEGYFGKAIEALGVPLYCLNMEPSRPTPLALLKLLAMVRQARPDLIQGWMYHGNLAGQLASRVCGNVPVIWCVHKSVSALSDEKPMTAALIRLGARLSHLPAAIVYVSEVGRAQHEALGYAASKSLVIANGIDTDLFQPSAAARQSVRNELGIAADRPLIGLLARYHPQKDHATFLQAAALLRQRMPGVHFLLAGTGVDRHNHELMALVEQHNHGAHIHLLGERRDTPQLLAACDLATSSSAFGEGLSLALAEAMAAGVPCVVTDVGDSGRLVGETGRVVAPRDPQALATAWAELLAAPAEEQQARSQAARQRICEGYSLGRMIQRYCELYERGALPTPRVVFIGGPDVDARLELMQQLRGGFELSALGTEPGLQTRFAEAGFAYSHYRWPGLQRIGALAQLVGQLRTLQPQIVHTYATRPSVWGRIAARLAGVPIIVGTLPGLGSLYASESLRVRALRALYQPLQKLACRVSDRTIFQNRDDLQQFTAAGLIEGARALLIPGSGVPTEQFAPERISASERARVRAELGIDDDAIMVTMVSRLIRSKGVLDYGAAAQRLAASHPTIRFVLVGPRDTQSVDRLNDEEMAMLGQAVTWPGPRQDIAALLAASDLFVLPSAYREGIPRVLLEAASMGLPIVTTDTPGCREVVVHHENGLLVPVHHPQRLAAAIATLAADQALREQYGQRSRQRATALFDLAVIAKQTSSLYRKLLADKGL
jgi:glycosyltransferase involved in cell wall biosynthesis